MGITNAYTIQPKQIKYEYLAKPLSKAFRAWLDSHASQIEEVTSEYDGYAGDDNKASYWVYLRKGWINEDRHSIHECTIAEVKAVFKLIQPCDCSQCLSPAAKEFIKRLG